MFVNVSTWALMLAAVSCVMTSPLSPGKYNRSAEANPGSCQPYCPPGQFCIQVQCSEGFCPQGCANCPACQTAASKRSTETELIDRQFNCPPGSVCIQPACEGPFCFLDGCADAPACQNTTAKRSPEAAVANRQFECPPGIKCGHGPACTAATCDLPACADAEVCQDQDPKRSLVERQLGCPPGVPCGHGPVCTPELCDLPGCADADVCLDVRVSKRKAETEIIRPICDVCHVNDDGVVECCAAIVRGGLERRESERACPTFCITTEDGEFLCGCDAQDYLNSWK